MEEGRSPSNYGPLSNLSCISKVLESGAVPSAATSANLRQIQSVPVAVKGRQVDRDTALLEILDGIHRAADEKEISVLISLDLSAACVRHRQSNATERTTAARMRNRRCDVGGKCSTRIVPCARNDDGLPCMTSATPTLCRFLEWPRSCAEDRRQ